MTASVEQDPVCCLAEPDPVRCMAESVAALKSEAPATENVEATTTTKKPAPYTVQKGLFRSVVAKSLKTSGAGSTGFLPDPKEAVHTELYIAPTEAMLKMMNKPTATPELKLSEVLELLRQGIHGRKLVDEVEKCEIVRRDSKDHQRFLNSLTPIERIRLLSVEKSYQKMLHGVQQINALRNRTQDPTKSGTMREIRQSLGVGVSALMVFALSFFIGFYVTLLMGVVDVGPRLVAGLVTSALAGLLEVTILITHYNKIDLIAKKRMRKPKVLREADLLPAQLTETTEPPAGSSSTEDLDMHPHHEHDLAQRRAAEDKNG